MPRPEGHYDPMMFNRHLRWACKRAGLGEDAVTPHRLRHSFVTNMLRMGVDILTTSRLANHSDVSITQRYGYTESDPLRALLAETGPGVDATPSLMKVSPW